MIPSPGTLFVVATPIGNLEDLTFRALRTIGEVDLIAAEDTRRTAKLLAHYNIKRPVISLREHNELREGPKLVRRMVAGEHIALVTDAGTPGLSDPGAGLVSMARAAGLRVVPIPGCSAITTALSVSGLAIESFRFAGFPPTSGRARDAWFEDLAMSNEAVVFLEAPHRIVATLQRMRGNVGNRRILVFRELTKINEELVEYTTSVTAGPVERGEITVVLGPKELEHTEIPDETEVVRLFGELTKGRVFTSSEALDILARLSRTPEPHARNRLKRAILSAKRQNTASS